MASTDTLGTLLDKLQTSTNNDALVNCGPVISDKTWELRQFYKMAVYSDQIGDSVYRDKLLEFTFNNFNG
jgi:hypothetical protein